ncbi:MAG: PD-(D/E)XK nuclease family protein [Gemmiger sp.]|uniref:PD-(D/E)XK nuclease family protein n=1 Tax=Gemmiger sp. TaxID=2049027 RepID=UPI002E7622BA|nr:PD-(D/E)XK nuclease family protein [Gemmiger sp.]MEE0800269.1 PD-(D/E)XK nuclease family protein [Gemmiger sp.]
MLTLILGPSGSGKSVRLRRELKQRAEKGSASLLIVPEQFTSSTEAALYRTLGDTLSGYVESYSFTSLAETLLRRYGGAAVPTLTEAGRAVLVRRALDQMMDKVVYYSRQRRSAAFCQKAAETISELKSAGIRPETLADYASAPGADRDKLSELALLYGTYESLLAETAMDPGDRVELAARSLSPEFFAGRTVFIDEFDTFNASKRAMLAAMLPVTDVTVSLCCDDAAEQEGLTDVFSGMRRVANTLRAMANRAGVACRTEKLTEDLRHRKTPVLAELGLLLADPTYTPEHTVDPAAPAIVSYRADSRQAEAKAVAAAVKARARAGMPYRRMAVICRTAEQYLPAVRYEFRLQGIPLFCDEPTTPENTAPARAVRAALDLLRGGITSNTVLKLVKTGLVDLEQPVLCALENYAYTWQLSAADWREPFTRNPSGYTDRMTEQDQRDLADAETARAFLVPRARRWMDRARGADAAELTRGLYAFLQAVGAESALQKLTDALRAQGELPGADEALREWNVVMGLLDQMVRLLPAGSPISAADYDDLFTLLLRTTDLGHIPQSIDSVILTTAGRMRLPETDAVFVLGLAEGEFPQTPGDSGLLSHADRDAMIAQGADLPDCFENRVIREQVCFYKALTAARQFLWVSWPGGAAGLPCSTALAPALELLNVPETVPDPVSLAATPSSALDLLGSVWQQNTPLRASVLEALHAVENTPHAAPGLAAIRRAARREPARVEDVRELEGLLGRSVRISPTRFERYVSCPFAYFMQYVLGARVRRKAELAPNISGTLTHWVLEQALRRQGEQFTDLKPDEIQALVTALIEEYTRDNLPGAGTRMTYLLGRIGRNLVGLLSFIQRDMRQSGFHPVAFELRIDDRPDADAPEAPQVPPVTLTDEEGHTVRVVGTVDRVDAMKLGTTTYLRVVDYKTGTKKFDLREVYYGLDCQMLLYLFTLERNAGNLFPGARAAGVEYLLADPPQQTGARPAADAAQPDKPQDYPLEGLLLDEPSVYHAMDTHGTGAFVPLTFSAKTGEPTAVSAKAHLADRETLDRIRDHLDELLIGMARDLYGGRIDAAPLVPGEGKSPCNWCDFRAVCRHADGEGERTVRKTEDPFEQTPEKQKES